MREKKTFETSLIDFIQHGQPPSDFFINPDIVELTNIELKGFEFFFKLMGLDKITRRELYFILSDARRLPAALGGYHGDYQGGLFDHTLLVANFTNFYYNRDVDDNSWLFQALLTAICHDFGKIHYYGVKCGLFDLNIKLERSESERIRSEIHSKYKLVGNDRHVENGIAVIRKYLTNYNQLFDDDMYIGVVFHHGPWSKYRPHNFTKLSSLIHKADMKASQGLKI
jgi:hypothetical protein